MIYLVRLGVKPPGQYLLRMCLCSIKYSICQSDNNKMIGDQDHERRRGIVGLFDPSFRLMVESA